MLARRTMRTQIITSPRPVSELWISGRPPQGGKALSLSLSLLYLRMCVRASYVCLWLLFSAKFVHTWAFTYQGFLTGECHTQSHICICVYTYTLLHIYLYIYTHLQIHTYTCEYTQSVTDLVSSLLNRSLQDERSRWEFDFTKLEIRKVSTFPTNDKSFHRPFFLYNFRITNEKQMPN